MRKSTNFNLNLVEGNDLVNPLVQDVPNYETIDEQMYKNECNSIGIATELKSGTVHALTRTIPNAPMFRFKATSNFTAGDTFTVDGVQVSALTPNGETLASNSYIIGSEVLCVLRETLLTVYVSGGVVITAQDSEKLGGQLPEYYGTAEDVTTALTTAQSANQLTLNLQQSVNNINSNLNMRYNPLSDAIEIYLNGEWKTWIDVNFTSLVLLDKSDVKSEITGGWSTSGYNFYGSTNTQTFAIGSNGFTLTTSGGRIGIATNNAIDITNYSKLVVKGYFTSIVGTGMGIHLSTTKSFNASTNRHSILASDTEISIDVSDLSGLYYIGFAQNDNYTVGTVHSVKLAI